MDNTVGTNTASGLPPSYAEIEGSQGYQGESQDQASNNPNEPSPNLKILCWNIDGLDSDDLEERTDAILQTILLKKPDVVFLQEVVPYSLEVFKESCEGYMVLVGNYSFEYFNAILLRKSSIQTNGSALQFLPFQTSSMGRHYLTQSIQFAGAKIILMTSHLESLGNQAAERKGQLREIFLYMNRRNTDVNVIFGGDTNLRDREVTAVGGLPRDIQDAWESCGSQSATKFTWDLRENDNKRMPGGNQPQLRFDRVFLRPARGSKTLTPQTFTLVGKERLEGCERFASDHWAIWLELGVKE